MGFVHIDHVGLVAATIEQARQVLGDALGLDLDEARSQWPTGSYFPPEQTYNYFFQVGEGETQVEVLIPEAGATSGAARFLVKRGPGLHHICYACADVHAEAERLLGRGLSEIDIPRGASGRRTVAFFHPRGTGGVLTELVPVRGPRAHRPNG
jgi:methylmalonyl-CoA epimerase